MRWSILFLIFCFVGASGWYVWSKGYFPFYLHHTSQQSPEMVVTDNPQGAIEDPRQHRRVATQQGTNELEVATDRSGGTGKKDSSTNSSQDRGLDVVLVHTEDGDTIKYLQSHALLIGNVNYSQPGWSSLPKIDEELNQVKTALEEQGFGIFEQKVHRNETGDGMRSLIRRFFAEHGVTDEDEPNRLLIFYSGHGEMVGKDGYLVGVDAPSKVEQGEFYLESLGMPEVRTLMSGAKARHVLMVCDSCFSGKLFDNVRGGRLVPPPFISNLEARPVRAILTAGRAGETVPAESIFAPLFVKGIRGAADQGDRDGYITGLELAAYLQPLVANALTAKPTNVLFGKLEGEGDFVFSLRPSEVREGTFAGEELDNNALGMEFVWCPPGNFLMGSPENEVGRREDEEQRSVTLADGFWIGKYEVTQEQWKKVFGLNPSSHRGKGRLPVENVRWGEALEFCRVLTENERQAKRISSDWAFTLPTEAQWEFACRSGAETPFSLGEGPVNSELANFSGINSYGGAMHGPDLVVTTPVGSYRTNRWGIHDMHGNVGEWCIDWYSPKLGGGKDPVAMEALHEVRKVVRGGSHGAIGADCRSAARRSDDPTESSSKVGFRVALVREASWLVQDVDEHLQSVRRPLYDQSDALVIVNSDYDFWPELNSNKEGSHVANALKSQGFKIYKEGAQTNLNSSEIRATIEEFLLQRGRQQKIDRRLVYFSGHGASIGMREFLVGVDTPMLGDAAFYRHSVDFESLKSLAMSTDVRHLLFVLNSEIRGYGIKERGSIELRSRISSRTPDDRRSFLISSVSGDRRFELEFLKGIEGAADSGEHDGVVTDHEVAQFIGRSLSVVFGKLRHPYDQGDFVFGRDPKVR